MELAFTRTTPSRSKSLDFDCDDSRFLFKNRRFVSIDQGLSAVRGESTASSSLYSVDSDYTDWGSFSEDDEIEPSGEPPRSKVYHIAKELLTTERTFVKGLTLLDKDFRQAVLSANRAHDNPVLPEETLNAILSNVGSLYVLNGGLLSQLEERLATWDSNPKIGDILLSIAPFLKMYTEYIANFENALNLLEESCKKNRTFEELVREFESQTICGNLPLSGYLLETVQRIPRYKLLLQDYLKHLPEDSNDRQDSERSLELISKVAVHVNESMRQVDNFKKLMEVQKKLVGDDGDSLISPSRKLLKEGELLKYSRKEIQSRMFFLFTDILIYASAIPPANTTYKVIKRISLRGMKVSDLDDPEVKHGLQIISTSKSFRLGTSTEEEKIQWMEALKDALSQYEASTLSRERYKSKYIATTHVSNGINQESEELLGDLAPPWLPDSCVSMCMTCSMRFTMTRRRHHCRGCGKIFCSPCSSYLAALKYQGNKMDRVCQSCFEKLSEINDNVDGNCRTTHKRLKSKTMRSATKLVKPAVLEVKARERKCDISGYLLMKKKKWKKQWLEVTEFVLYVFERHEDVSSIQSITLPGYTVIYPIPVKLEVSTSKAKFCLSHPGAGPLFFKAQSEEVAMKWVECFQNAVRLKSTADSD